MIEIYKITNLINDKCYIGQTKQGTFKRFQQHGKTDSLIGRAIKKYGHDNFLMEILEATDSEDIASELEHKYILTNDCVVPKGYNANEHGRLLGIMVTSNWYIFLKPEYYNKVKNDGVHMLYFYKAVALSDKEFALKINHKTYVSNWGELWNTIDCTDSNMRKKVKQFMESNGFATKKNNKIILNKEKFKIIY